MTKAGENFGAVFVGFILRNANASITNHNFKLVHIECKEMGSCHPMMCTTENQVNSCASDVRDMQPARPGHHDAEDTLPPLLPHKTRSTKDDILKYEIYRYIAISKVDSPLWQDLLT